MHFRGGEDVLLPGSVRQELGQRFLTDLFLLLAVLLLVPLGTDLSSEGCVTDGTILSFVLGTRACTRGSDLGGRFGIPGHPS